MNAPGTLQAFIAQVPHLTPMAILSFFLLGLMRMVPIVALAPFLGSRLPGGAKIGLAISITLILLPNLMLTTKNPLTFNAFFFELALKELLIGLMIAILATIPFYMAESAGILVDHMRGSSSIMAMDPLMQTQVSPIGILYNWILVVIFFEVNGPFLFIDAVMQTYSVVPVDGFLNPLFFSLDNPYWKLATGLMTKILTSSIQLAAPSLVGILMADMFLGITNRLAPQVQIAFLGISIKSMLGLALLWAGWYYILKQIANQSLHWLKEISTALSSF
jgi:type III secretion protein T